MHQTVDKRRKPDASCCSTRDAGYIRLELPVFHVGYVKHLVGILQCVCKSCARVMVLEDERRHFLRRLRSPRTEVCSVWPWCPAMSV